MRCWLEHPEGVRRWVGPGGLLLGREADCDLVFEDSRISRHHAMIRQGQAGPEIIHMGRNPSRVNGKRDNGTQALKDGDEIEFPGGQILKVGIADANSRRSPMAWIVERAAGGRYGVRRYPFSIGGTQDDDLSFMGWPGEALVIRRAQGSLFMQATVPCKYNGAELDDMTPVFPGDRVEVEGEMLRFSLVGQDGERVTVVPERAQRIVSLKLSFLPTGGRLVVRFNDDETQVYMPERRFALIATLLTPSGLDPGDYIEDEVVCSKVWPRNPNKGREHVNVLLKRAREDLVKAGLNGFKLLERARGGGATRFVVPPGCSVDVQ